MSARTSLAYIENKAIIKPNPQFLSKEIVNSLGKTLFQINCSDCKKKLNFSNASNFAKHRTRFHPEKYPKIKKEKKKKSPSNAKKLVLEDTKKTRKLHWLEGFNGAGEKIFKTVCPVCHQWFAFPRSKDGIYRHLFREHQIGDPPKETSVLAPREYLYSNPDKIAEFKAERIFYVDAAQSIKSNDGKVYWKTSLVENNEEISGWANSKSSWANGAEAYAILKTILYLVENKITSRVLIYSDNTTCVLYMNELDKEVKSKEPDFCRYINFARKLIKENNLQVMVSWVQGKFNPADYYSRLPYKTHNSKLYTSKRIKVPLN